MPGPIIQIKDIPVKDFQQFISGRRFSAIVQLSKPPYHGQDVHLKVIQTRPPQPQPRTLFKHVNNFIYMDTFSTTHDTYELTLID